jgi:alpha-L-fucosidase
MVEPASPAQTESETDPLVLKNLEHFKDMKFGLMMHWGVYSIWGAVESWPICDAEPYGRNALPQWEQSGKNVETFMKMYFDLNTQFNPIHFKPEAWADAANDAGMKYLVFTTKHHDGFCMYDTRQTNYRTTHPLCPFHSSPKADITKVLFHAFRQRGFRIGAYYSKADWHNPNYWDPVYRRLAREANYDPAEHPALWAAYVDFVHKQIRELMAGYGPIDILWLDSDWVRPPREDINMSGLARMAREHQPGLIMVDRAVGGRYENYKTPEQTVPDAYFEGTWEGCLTMGEQWSYNPADKYKSVRQLIHTLVQIVARGGNLLLNMGPYPEGRLRGGHGAISRNWQVDPGQRRGSL